MVTSARAALATPITSKPSIAASALVPAAVAGIDRPITTTVVAVAVMVPAVSLPFLLLSLFWRCWG